MEPIANLNGETMPLAQAKVPALDRGFLLGDAVYEVLRVYRRGKERPWDMLAEVRYGPSSVEGIAWDGFDLILVSEGGGIDRVSESAWKSNTFHAKTQGKDAKTPRR